MASMPQPYPRMPQQPRRKPMEVIGLGMSRTATLCKYTEHVRLLSLTFCRDLYGPANPGLQPISHERKPLGLPERLNSQLELCN